MSNWTLPSGKSEEQVWSELEPRLKSVAVKQGTIVRLAWIKWASAAAALACILISAWWLFRSEGSTIEHATSFSQKQLITLPDGSSATLNAQSTIRYSDTWNNERSLYLQGQAFFEVKPGSRFTVKTDYGTVEVKGTSFDVLARPEKFMVQCHTGKVLVNSSGSDVQLTSGMLATLSGQSLTAKPFDVTIRDWRNGIFRFTEEPLYNIFKEIERQFDVEIVLPDLSGRTCSAAFEANSLEAAMDIVCTSMQLSWHRGEGNRIIVEK